MIKFSDMPIGTYFFGILHGRRCNIWQKINNNKHENCQFVMYYESGKTCGGRGGVYTTNLQVGYEVLSDEEKAQLL